jgi:hypothetical protein
MTLMRKKKQRKIVIAVNESKTYQIFQLVYL